MNINTTLKDFPEPMALFQHLKAACIIDAIMTDNNADVNGPIFKYNPKWSGSIVLFSINENDQNVFHTLFSKAGCIVKGFERCCELSPFAYDNKADVPGCDYFYAGMPLMLRSLLSYPELSKDTVTFCAWRETADTAWRSADILLPEDSNDGSSIYWDYTADMGYVKYFCVYYGFEAMPVTVLDILRGAAVTADMVAGLNPKANVNKVMAEINNINKTAVI